MTGESPQNFPPDAPPPAVPTSGPPPAIPLSYTRVGYGPRRQGMAITALVLGILSLVPGVLCLPVGVILALIGLILGIIALVRATRTPEQFGGTGKAVAGIITSGLAILITPLALSVMLPSLSRARELAKRAVDSTNLVGIGQACAIYSQDHGATPPDLNTLVTAGLVSPKQLLSPSAGHVPPACDYNYIVYPPGAAAQITPDWFVAYTDPQIHVGEGSVVLFFDGHVEFVKTPDFTQRLADFKQKYQDTFGRPPTIIPATSP